MCYCGYGKKYTLAMPSCTIFSFKELYLHSAKQLKVFKFSYVLLRDTLSCLVNVLKIRLFNFYGADWF